MSEVSLIFQQPFTAQSKMRTIALILLILRSCSAYYVEDCITQCKDSNPLDEWEQEGFAPNLYMLGKLCPKTLEFLDCRMKEMQDCLEERFEELVMSTNLSVASFSRVILATDYLVRQLCNKNSSFHKDYARKVDCYKAFFYVIRQFCQEDTKRIKNSFLDTMKVTPKEDTDCKIKLLIGPYKLACESDLVGRACGTAAQRLHTTATLMFKDIFLVDCEHVNQSWREEYLDFLIADKKREFEEIYDVFFKRF